MHLCKVVSFRRNGPQVCGKELKHRPVNVGEYYGLEILSSATWWALLVKSNTAAHPFAPELPCCHHRLYVIQNYIDGTAQIATEAGDCGE